MARILIVDDTAVDRDLLRTVLAHFGHEVREAADGEAGLRAAIEQPPDLLITDILMPKLDGYELARRLRADPSLGQTRIVFSTANTIEPRLLALTRSCGASAVIPKPSDPEEIMRIIDSALAAPPVELRQESADGFRQSHQAVLNQAILDKVDELRRANEQLRATESSLRTSEERLRFVMQQMPAGLWTTDDRLRFTSVAGRVLGELGYDSERLIGLSVSEALENPDPSFQPNAAHLDALRGVPAAYAMELGGKSFETQVEPLRDVAGAIIGTVGVTIDVTERIRAEHEQATLRAQLEQSQRLESIGSLAGGIAHDFNNLLAVILSYAGFIAEEAVSEEVRRDVLEVQRAAERAAALTRQLLIFSRKEMTKPEPVDLGVLIGELQRLLSRTIGEHIELRMDIADELRTILADPGKIEQVIVNLAINARDAMPGGGRLVVEAANVDISLGEDWPGVELAPGSYVRLAVSDNGNGMTQEVLERALEPFFTTKPRGQGTGLGLAMVYGIVTEAGGQMTIRSESGKGTGVQLYFPVGEGTAQPQPSDVEIHAGEGELILVVEDEDAVREIARRMLVGTGFTVATAADPDEALRVIREGLVPAMLVTDVVMPKMSGRELAIKVRDLLPRIPVLYMSGYPSDFVASGVGTGEGTLLLRKPFTQRDLLRSIRRLFESTQSQGGASVEGALRRP